MPSRAVNWGWFWAAVALTGAKLWLTGGQTIFAIGPAFHDDKLFVELAAHLIKGDWLGPYNEFTLAKGPLFPLFIAGVFWLGLPLLQAQQVCYALASAALTRSLSPWLRSGAAQFALYGVLLCNPMSYDAANLGRLMRQNLYTPLALLVITGLILLFARRRESWRRQAGPAGLAGLALGGFWLTREESVWLLPAVGLLLLGTVGALAREWRNHWRHLGTSFAILGLAALTPILLICSLNLKHYGWFGTVEFRAAEFKDAYGALTRIQTGPELAQVPVTRQMREQAYLLSPAFARLKPHLEGPVGDQWSEKNLFPAAERQIRGGWFIWALREAVAAAGLAPDAGSALRYYQQIAEEVNAACDAGRVPARPVRSGFLPVLGAKDIGPLRDGAIAYASYFFGFKGFSAVAPDSLGDYAELKPFRDMVGTHLSQAPRSPDPLPPGQAALAESRVRQLESIGLGLGRLFSWLGPLVLLVGLVRVLESLLDRHLTFLLGLALALLSACGAYLTINILVHVTSFYNLSPAAMASAYPLYLVALGAIVADAIAAWRQPGRVMVRTSATKLPRPARWAWLVPAGTALIVFAARLREIHLYASDVPYNDQWIIEAEQIIAPWLNGTLGIGAFFTPHFEHLPVWTRLLSWLQVVLTGRWDPLVQMTVNAGLHSSFIWLAARWVWHSVAPKSAAFVLAVLILGGSLPHAWENIAWGFQSQFPLALIFLMLHVWGTCYHAAGTRGWWWAQGAAVAGLFTLASMWLAPLAVVISLLWTGGFNRRQLIAPLGLTALGVILLVAIHSQSSAGHSFAQVISSPWVFLHSFLHLLSWPSGLPGALAIIQLPWMTHALRLRRQRNAQPLDRMIFILGLWNCAQAGALAFARAGDNADYVSRYGDLLFIGVLAGALALTRLMPETRRARTVFLIGALLWSTLVVAGLFFHATEGHARYFHENAAASAQRRNAAVQAYLKNGDKQLLEQVETRWVLTHYTHVVTHLLDQPAFRALLPAAVNPASPPDLAGRINRQVQAHWLGLLALGGVLFTAGFSVAGWRGASAGDTPPLPVTFDHWGERLALATGLVSTVLLFSWNDPLAFNQAKRWRELLGGDKAISGLSFEFVTPSPFGAERLIGAAPIRPESLRNQFFGTAPAGPTFTGTVLSSAFIIEKPWLIIPFAGYPTGNGNGMRLRLVKDAATLTGEELGCPGPNGDGIYYWPLEVRAHQGEYARLVLYDGRTDTEAWVAVAPPIPSDSAELATILAQRLEKEKQAGMHTALAMIALVSFLCAFLAWCGRRFAA